MKKQAALAAACALIVCSAGCTYRAGVIRQNTSARPAKITGLPAGASRTPSGTRSATDISLSSQYKYAASLCENIYAAAARGAWSQCASLNSQLNARLNQKNSMLSATQNSNSGAVNATLTQLNQGIAAMDAKKTQKCANQLYNLITDATSGSTPAEVTSVSKIRYYCRQIQMTDSLAAAKKDCGSLVSYWNRTKVPGVPTVNTNSPSQKLVNSINRCLADGKLSQAQSYCNQLLSQATTRGQMV